MSWRAFSIAALGLALQTGFANPAEREAVDAGAGQGSAKQELQERADGSQADGSNSETPRPTERSPRILFIVERDCGRCEEELARLRRPGGSFEAMRTRGWKIGETPDNHLQIVDRDQFPELVEQLSVREFPTVACVSDGQVVRYFKDGCTTPLDSWTFGWLLKGANERPRAVVPEAVRVQTTGSYPLRGNHWSVEGDWNPSREKIISHLRGPNHASQLQVSWAIDSWAYEELRSVHDDLHEREMASSAASSPGSSPGGSYMPQAQMQAAAPRSLPFSNAGHKMLGR